jgi:hypothetical protein
VRPLIWAGEDELIGGPHCLQPPVLPLCRVKSRSWEASVYQGVCARGDPACLVPTPWGYLCRTQNSNWKTYWKMRCRSWRQKKYLTFSCMVIVHYSLIHPSCRSVTRANQSGRAYIHLHDWLDRYHVTGVCLVFVRARFVICVLIACSRVLLLVIRRFCYVFSIPFLVSPKKKSKKISRRLSTFQTMGEFKSEIKKKPSWGTF